MPGPIVGAGLPGLIFANYPDMRKAVDNDQKNRKAQARWRENHIVKRRTAF